MVATIDEDAITLWRAAYHTGCRLQDDDVYGLLAAVLGISVDEVVMMSHSHIRTSPEMKAKLRMLSADYGDILLKAKLRGMGYIPQHVALGDENKPVVRWRKAKR